WRGAYTDPTIHKQRYVYGKTQAECKAKLDAKLAEIRGGSYVPPDKMTVEAWLLFWFDNFYRRSVKASTAATAKSNLEDKLKGLSLGAEDYIVKPFEMQELLARVRVVLRRTKRDSNEFSFDGLTVDFNARKVFRGEEEIILAPKEFALLEALIKNRNIALSREKILCLVWAFDYEGDTRTVDVHVQKLRQKLELKDRIRTIYKVGYRFEV
ncbi:MAG: response regulator transcription factor, partial [Clostridia bacterium]|nr:response regulator transcription factor [Clostridia bacterium]